jgi:hypothetical protein
MQQISEIDVEERTPLRPFLAQQCTAASNLFWPTIALPSASSASATSGASDRAGYEAPPARGAIHHAARAAVRPRVPGVRRGVAGSSSCSSARTPPSASFSERSRRAFGKRHLVEVCRRASRVRLRSRTSNPWNRPRSRFGGRAGSLYRRSKYRWHWPVQTP